MLNTLKYLVVFMVIGSLVVSCDSYPSLQKYYVDSQSSSDFISLDVPASIVSLKDGDASEEVRSTLKTVRKINFLGFQITEDNKEEYLAEQKKIKVILKNPKYQDLVKLNFGKRSLTVKFLGDEDAINEVIFYGADKELGFALVRVLGNEMDPSKMMALAQEINIDGESSSMKQITSFMSSIK